MKKILILMTGGTIGSTEKNGVISADSGRMRALELYCKKYGSDEGFVCKRLINILSENLTASHWETVINYLLSADLSQYKGVIITHGSDTLTYSSAMLGICLHGLGLPIVITAADYVPDAPNSNAVINLHGAVSIIYQMKDGVYTVFRNRTENAAQVFIPTRMVQDRLNDLFLAADNEPAGFIDEKGRILDGECKFSLRELESVKRLQGISEVSFTKSVLILHPYPSIDYKSVFIPEKTGAVMLVTYHSGTASENAKYLLNKCRDMNIPVFLCSLKRNASALYETSSELLSSGALPLYDITVESAYAKLLLYCNIPPIHNDSFLYDDIYFEALN